MLQKTMNRHVHALAVWATLTLMVLTFVAMVAFAFSTPQMITRGQFVVAVMVQMWLLAVIVGLAVVAFRIYQRMQG